MTNKDRRTLSRLFLLFTTNKHLLIPETIEDIRKLPAVIGTLPLPFVTVMGTNLFLDEQGLTDYRRFLDLLVKEKSISRFLSPSSINDIVKQHVSEYLEDAINNHAKTLTRDLVLEKLLVTLSGAGEKKATEVHLLANGLRLRDGTSFKLGNVTFSKIDETFCDKILPLEELSNDSTEQCKAISDEQRAQARQNRMAQRKSLIGGTGINVVCNGDIIKSYEAAYRECQITLGALSLYPIIFTFESVQPYLFRLVASGLKLQDFGPVFGFDVQSGARSFMYGGLISGSVLDLGSTELEKFRAYGWDQVSEFLRTRSNENEVDTQLTTSLFWIGQAVAETVTAASITKYFIAIESLLIGSTISEQIVEKVAKRLAVLIGEEVEDAIELRKSITKEQGLYYLRSQISHAGKYEEIDRKRYLQIGSLAAWTFLRFLQARGYRSLDRAIEHLDKAAETLFQKVKKPEN